MNEIFSTQEKNHIFKPTCKFPFIIQTKTNDLCRKVLEVKLWKKCHSYPTYLVKQSFLYDN